MRRITAIAAAFLIFVGPIIIHAQMTETEENKESTESAPPDPDICLQAQADAKQDLKSWLWIGAGCVFHLLGVGAAYLVKSGPPPERLIGKSVEYVNSYTECYVKQARKSQGGSAWIGCGVAGGVYLITGTILMIAAANSASNACSDACSGVTIDCTPSLSLFAR